MAIAPLFPARLEYADGVPYSSQYHDIYHSAEGAIGQSRHVFLHGCGLPDAWAGRENFVVLETGFGAGLNFLTTWKAWRDDPSRATRLHFISAEKHPFTAHDLAVLHRAWPAFAAQSQALLDNWPTRVPGFHRIAFDDGRVLLTLMLGDAADCMAQLDARVDAIYLDGFAPDRNPDLWQPTLLNELTRLARPGARLATYTVAASVREALAAAGFEAQKRVGFGSKRHCLTARFAGSANDETPPACVVPRTVAVVGAGVAGCAVAHALAQRGIEVTVIERADAPAQGASGNPVAAFRPLPSRDDNRASRITRAAFLYSLRAWAGLGPALQWSRCGVLHCASDAEHAHKLRQTLLANDAPPEFARWIDAHEASHLAGWPLADPAVFYPEGGWIVPVSLCHVWLAHPLIRTQYGRRVSALEKSATGWRLMNGARETLADVDAVVLANACDAVSLAPELQCLQAVRGQINIAAAAALPVTRVVAREGYVSPTPDGRHVVGSTYEYDADCEENVAASAWGDAENRARLQAILPGAAVGDFPGRAAIRAVMPDRFPLLGALPDRDKVFVATGYASRGVVWAGLLAETLASRICHEPLPLERDLFKAMDPAR